MTENTKTESFSPRVTGKQVLADAVTLFKDTGTFLYDLSKLIVIKLKTVLTNEKKDKEVPTDAKPQSVQT